LAGHPKAIMPTRITASIAPRKLQFFMVSSNFGKFTAPTFY
jgi:hypothetical protein